MHTNVVPIPKLLTCISLIFLFTQGCATLKRPSIPLARIGDYKRPFFAGQIVETSTGKTLDFQDLIAQVSTARLIFIGEVHNNPDHHLIQIQILQALKEKWNSIALGVEALPKEVQFILDDYIRSNIKESEFLKRVKWEKVWGFDYHFYRPLFVFQKQNFNDVVALNLPHEIVKKVATKGIDGLSPKERGKLPSFLDLSNKKYRNYLLEIFKSHAGGQIKNFEYFYEAQCVWDETMAQNIYDFLEANPGKNMVVVAGNGHIVYRFGIPERVIRRKKIKIATIVPYPLISEVSFEKDIADYVWLTGRYIRMGKGLHGKKRKKNMRD